MSFIQLKQVTNPGSHDDPREISDVLVNMELVEFMSAGNVIQGKPEKTVLTTISDHWIYVTQTIPDIMEMIDYPERTGETHWTARWVPIPPEEFQRRFGMSYEEYRRLPKKEREQVDLQHEQTDRGKESGNETSP